MADAGLPLNKMQERISSDFVLDRYAEVCRHYSRPPSIAELKYYAIGIPGFLNKSTFAKHFGGKAEIIVALRDRAIERGENDLLAILPNVEISSPPAVASFSEVSEGWVYLLKSGEHFKIGRSDDLEKRVKQISIALPEKVEMVHAIQTDDPPGIETYWHRRFAEHRANGEWFKLLPTDVKAYKRRKFQ